RLLDRIKNNFEMSHCYLMDKNGVTVASSNRNENNGFVGTSFANRPYFAGAAAGRLTTYFALGKITRERGYFASIPVIGSDGTITGVVAVKRNVTIVEEFFKKYSHVYLASPEGIIFISSRPDFLFRSLWPVAERKRSELLTSGQFGDIAFEPLLAAEPGTGTYVRFENEEHYLQRLPFGRDGWSLVVMDDPGIVSSYRMFGIMLTAVFALLLLFFFNLLLYKNRSLETARDLLKSRDDWKLTFDTVPDFIAIIGADYRITSMNSAMAKRLSISPQEAVGRLCYELLHGSQEPPASCPHRRMLASGRTEFEASFNKNLNGYFIITAAPVLAEDGTIASSIHVMHDISELKKLEQSLKEYAQRLEFVLEASNDASWEWDIRTDQCVLNSMFYEMLEYTPGEVDINFDLLMKTIHPDDVYELEKALTGLMLGQNRIYPVQCRMVTKSGKLRHVMGRGKIVMFDEDGLPSKMAGVVTDVTEMKQLSDEVNRINNLESIGLLSGGLAHDFNNVLNIIYGNISFVKMLAGGESAFLEPLNDAEEACERAKELGIRLQALSHGSAPFKEPLALAELIEDTAVTLFKGANISHSLFAAADVISIEADPRQIRQVFENLLTNAKESMSAGGTVAIYINNYLVGDNKILPLAAGRYVCIILQDDGKGIPEENLPKIFDPYFSTKDTFSQRGLGLGLSICHAILKRHNGHISVVSTVKIGTRVALYLPTSVVETTITSKG
ncbi:MAG: ATP-binding protein, partial [Pelobacteraceae bacterium]